MANGDGEGEGDYYRKGRRTRQGRPQGLRQTGQARGKGREEGREERRNTTACLACACLLAGHRDYLHNAVNEYAPSPIPAAGFSAPASWLLGDPGPSPWTGRTGRTGCEHGRAAPHRSTVSGKVVSLAQHRRGILDCRSLPSPSSPSPSPSPFSSSSSLLLPLLHRRPRLCRRGSCTRYMLWGTSYSAVPQCLATNSASISPSIRAPASSLACQARKTLTTGPFSSDPRMKTSLRKESSAMPKP